MGGELPGLFGLWVGGGPPPIARMLFAPFAHFSDIPVAFEMVREIGSPVLVAGGLPGFAALGFETEVLALAVPQVGKERLLTVLTDFLVF